MHLWLSCLSKDWNSGHKTKHKTNQRRNLAETKINLNKIILLNFYMFKFIKLLVRFEFIDKCSTWNYPLQFSCWFISNIPQTNFRSKQCKLRRVQAIVRYENKTFNICFERTFSCQELRSRPQMQQLRMTPKRCRKWSRF